VSGKATVADRFDEGILGTCDFVGLDSVVRVVSV
jgi:hypothetical protein